MFSKYQLICFTIGTFDRIFYAKIRLFGNKYQRTLSIDHNFTLWPRTITKGPQKQPSNLERCGKFWIFWQNLHFYNYWAVSEKLGVFDKVECFVKISYFYKNQTNVCPSWTCWRDSWFGGWNRGRANYKSRTQSRKTYFQIKQMNLSTVKNTFVNLKKIQFLICWMDFWGGGWKRRGL